MNQGHPEIADTGLETLACSGTGGQCARRLGWASGVLLGVALLAYGSTVVRTAWLCDDAYITFRTVDNFVSGYGLTWNVGERVQSYTHPLWMFLVSGVYFVTREVHYTVLFLSMALSGAAVLIYSLCVARTAAQAIVGVLILLFSKAFVDYSTSGLENPLSYLLLAGFTAIYVQDRPATGRRLFVLSLVACFGVLNRMDTVLLFGPMVAEAWWRTGLGRGGRQAGATKEPGRRLIQAGGVVLAGLVPLVAWEVFSVIYYGFPFPNTAYAKLNTGLAAGEYIKQGLRYLWNSIANDPLTLPAIATAIAAGVMRRRGRHVMMAIGIGLYVAYVVKIGGDFMSGRFLAAPLFVAVVLLGDLPIQLSKAKWLCAGLLVACVGLAGPHPSLLTTNTYGIAWSWNLEEDHVVDERAYYYATTGLLADSLGLKTPSNHVIDTAVSRRTQGGTVTGMGTIGMYGYYIGPDAYVVDVFALSDPLLARLPMIHRPNWRIGHFVRHVPDGYMERLQYLQKLEKLQAGELPEGEAEALVVQRFSDPNLEAFHDKLCLIVRGPVFSKERWEAIWKMNVGGYDNLIDREFYRNPPERVWLGEVYGGLRPRGIARELVRNDEGNLPLRPGGIIVILGNTIQAPILEISLDGDDDYQIDYPQPGRTPVHQTIPRAGDRSGQVIRRIDVPAEVVARGYDRFRIFPTGGDGRYSLHHVVPMAAIEPSGSIPATK